MADPQHRGARRKAPFPARGEIYLVALDPAVGHEIKKMRPAVVVQNDTSNEHLGTTIMAPITSAVRFPLSPTHVLIAEGKPSGLVITSMALLEQVRTVDKRRLIRALGHVSAQTMSQIDDAIKITLG